MIFTGKLSVLQPNFIFVGEMLVRNLEDSFFFDFGDLEAFLCWARLEVDDHGRFYWG